MGELASIASVKINSASQGKKELRFVSEFDPKDTASVTGEAMLGGKVGGVTFNPGDGHTFSLTSYIQKGKQEVDWYYLRNSKEPFIIEVEFVGGFKLQYVPAYVGSVTPKPAKDGKNTLSIEGIAQEVKPL